MQVKVTLETKRLKEALDKILDNEILFRVTERGVILEGLNEAKSYLISCRIERDNSYFAGLPERLFPAFELYRWTQKGEKIQITFERELHVSSFRAYYVEALEEVKV